MTRSCPFTRPLQAFGFAKLLSPFPKRLKSPFEAETLSPRPYVVAREMFSVRKHGYRKAKLLAIRARHAGLRNME
jgi:hypothetical protein